jgi:hypothetical protein
MTRARREVRAPLSFLKRPTDCRRMSLRLENLISSPYPAKQNRSAFMKRWVGPANSAKRTSNYDRCSAKGLPPTDGGTGTRRKRVLKAVSKSPGRMGRRACLLNASFTSAVLRLHPIGTASGTFLKNHSDAASLFSAQGGSERSLLDAQVVDLIAREAGQQLEG